jgi:putative DNA primase/helicase
MPDFEIYNNIPEEMKSIARWVCLNMVEEGGKQTKRPVSAHSGKVASITDEANWADFNTAIKYYQEHQDRINGIGFVFTDDDDIVGIDFDGCLDTDGNLINDTIQEIVSRNTSYIERSVSGTGLHVYLRGKLPTNTGVKLSTELSPHGFGIELYEQKRFFIVTGNAYPDGNTKLPVAENQDFIDYVFSLIPNAGRSFSSSTPISVNNKITENLNALLQEKLMNSNYFNQLWNGLRPKGNESSDDMALCCQLAQITTNPVEIQDLFFKSPHYQSKDEAHIKKCNRSDYMERTINNAMVFKSNRIDDSRSTYAYLLNYDDNDIGHGEKFAAMYNGQLIYVEAIDTWYHFDGICWEHISNTAIKCLARELQRNFDSVAKIIGDEARKRAAHALGSVDKINSMIKAAQIDLVVDKNILNTHNNLLAVQNGVVDLRTGQLIEPRSDYYITVKSPIAYNPDAPTPERFCQFMNEITCGDVELREYLLRILGYCLTGEIKEQAFFVFYGNGANGKSVLVNLLRNILGTLTGSVAQDAFILKRNGNSLNPSLVNVKDTRMAFVSEGNNGQEMDSALIKSISGGDDVQARELYKGFISLNPHFKIFITTNYMPAINFADDAMLRRTKIIRFENQFTGDKCDYELPGKLQAEAEGILKLLISYAVKYYQEGLAPYEPESISLNYNRCRAENDSIFSFICDYVQQSDDDKNYIQSSVLYNYYIVYCQTIGKKPESQKTFTQELHKQGYHSQVMTTKRVVCFTKIIYTGEILETAS